MLLKVWCVRRGYHRERDQMNGFLLTVLLAHLMDTRVVHAHGTPRQMFTTVMDWIATHPFGTWHPYMFDNCVQCRLHVHTLTGLFVF